MRYQHRFTVQAAIEGVVAFHHNSDNLKLLTPWPVKVRIHSAPTELAPGSPMVFELGLGPFTIPWRAQFEDVSAHAFTDIQTAGPYTSWSHRHVFRRIDEGRPEIEDRIEAKLKRHPIWGPFAALLCLGLPIMFRHRTRATRSHLESLDRG